MIDIREHGGIFGGGRGMEIKSVQRGVTSMLQESATIPITPVNVDKSIVIQTGNQISNYDVPSAWQYISTMEFVDGSNIKITNNSSSTVSQRSFYWSVVEFSGDVNIQRGVVSLGSERQKDIVIDAVNMDKTMVFVSWRGATSTVVGIKLLSLRAFLTSPTNIRFETYDGYNIAASYFIVEQK